MLSIVTRRIAAIAMVLSAIFLAGCGDKEPQQRKAFMEFMETRMLANKTISIPTLTDKDREAFGPYVAHYQVITDFNAGMNQSMGELRNISSLGRKIQTMKGLQENWKEIAAFRDVMKPVLGSVENNIQKAQAARASLTQPDDLKAVYDRAFDKVVVQPIEPVRKFIPSILKALDAMEAMGRFLDENRNEIQISGAMVQIDNPTLHQKMKTLQKNYLAAAQELAAVQQSIGQIFRR